MGKKVKKTTRNAQKEKQFSTSSSKNLLQNTIPAEVVDGVPVVKEARVCPHLDTGINLDKVSLKIASLESLKCDDCREGVADRRASKVKGKKKSSKSIWVCLECGHFTCGGVGFPTIPHSHATRHAKQNHHPLAVHFANPNLRWCFPCNTLIPVQTSEDNGEQKDAFSDVIKVLKAQPSSENSLDLEDVWFGNGHVTSEIKSVSGSENIGGYMVKGLINLGNTCFLNSILQNLLAMDKFRDFFLKLERPVGTLSVSLKKLFVETDPSTGAKDVINPRPLFNSVCAMAPQFKGYQQQDSHELLRFLLDGLCNEDSGEQKSAPSSPKHTPTFVDFVFGGQTSSRVSCLECGHTSIVYEPYLDLSLPLPIKKSTSKKMQPVSRSKKPKPPPKKRGKFGTKINRASGTSQAVGVPSGDTTQPESVVLAEHEHVTESNVMEKFSKITIEELDISSDNLALNTVDSSDISSWLDYVGPTIEASKQADSLGLEEPPALEDNSWLDYLEPCSSSNDHNTASQKDIIWEDEPQLKVQESEVLLVPYKEVTSNGNEQEPSDFDGFGGLFDEPEVVGPFSNGAVARNNSESDDDEVDNTDSPVSVDKCLAFFTTSELLNKSEHAWQCEQCSKALLNGAENRIPSIPSDSDMELSVSNGVRIPIDESSELEESKSIGNGGEERCTVQDTDSCQNEKIQKRVSTRLARQRAANGVKDDEVDSNTVKVTRDAYKRILINKVPPILTVHLKRLSQDARGRLSKLNGHVDFKDIIDLKPYMDPSCCADREAYRYRLIGVVEHLGTMRGGHYVAYVRVSKGYDDCLWYHANDAHVREVSLEEVLRCEAYILFYEEM